MNFPTKGDILRFLRLPATIAATIILLLAGSVPAFSQISVQKVLRSVEKRYRRVTHIGADLRMVKYVGQLNESDEYLGTLIFSKRIGRNLSLRIDWKRPAEILIIHGGRFTLYRPRYRVAYNGVVSRPIGDPVGQSALQFLTISRSELLARRDITVIGSEKLPDGKTTTHLRVVPKARSLYASAELWIDKSGLIHQVKLLSQNNDSTTITLTNIKKIPRLAPDLFKLHLPKGTKVHTT